MKGHKQTGAVDRSPKRNFLGKREAVAELLTEMSDGIVISLTHCLADDEIQAVIDDIHCQSESLADVLLGGLPYDYPPFPVWNVPGGIDQWLKRQFPEITETEPVQIVAWACDRYVTEIFDVLKRSETGDGWKAAAHAVAEQWASMLSGEQATLAANAATSR